MTQPTAYTRQYDFTGFSSNYPSDQQPGTSLDSEFNAVKTTLDGVLGNLSVIQRDDGKLTNSLVSLETLSPDVLEFFAAAGTWKLRGAWATTTVYAVNDVVTQSGSTYICVAAHTSGTFVTDLAAIKWITLYGSTTVVVPDNSVTTAKLADGAVTSAKVGFTALDLSGSIRGQTSLAAGTEVAGTYLVGAKNASGDAYNSVARTTRTQGNVGVRVGGGTSGADWYLRQASSVDVLQLYNSLGSVVTASFSTSGQSDWGYTLRVTGVLAPSSGAGVEVAYSAGIGAVQAYDRSGSAWKDMRVAGLTVKLTSGGVDVVNVTSTDATRIDGYGAAQSIGFLGIPQITKTASYTLALSDMGMMVSITTGGVVIPANSVVAFPIGTVIGVYNDSSSSQTISINTDTLRLQGTASTGSRTLAQRGFCTLMKVKATEWVASGVS